MVTYVKDELAFEAQEGDFTFKAWYLKKPNQGNAAIHIMKDGELVRAVLWPAYKIWNIAAHARDIVEDIDKGLHIAGSDGLGGNVYTGVEFELADEAKEV